MMAVNSIKNGLTAALLWPVCLSVLAGESLPTMAAADIVYPNNARNAISLTFDDARASQLTQGVAILNRHAIKATFYLLPGPVSEALPEWQAVAKQGHEIGNHTTSHLCSGNFQWLRDRNAGLEDATLATLEHDILDANRYLNENLQVSITSFAYPCGQTFVGRGTAVKSYVPLIAKWFDTGRRWMDETGNNPGYVDYAQLTSLPMDGKSFEAIKAMLEQYRGNNAWLILAGHEVGKGAQYTTDAAALERLIEYLKDPEQGYWIGTVSEVASHIRKQRNKQR